MESIILRHIITQLSVNTQGKIKRLNINKMKTEPTINIQDEVSKIHAQYGITEMANYRIEKLFEKHVEQFSPKVKQLEWVEVWEGHEDAKTPFGHYVVRPSIDNRVFLMVNPRKIIQPYSTLSEAKAEAQRDFEKRIKECLITE